LSPVKKLCCQARSRVPTCLKKGCMTILGPVFA